MRILLAHDGSPGAAHAAELARSIRWPADSSVRVVSVLEPTLVALNAWAGTAGAYRPEVDEAITAYLNDELAAVVNELSGPDRSVEGALLRGRPGTAIVDEAKAFEADLVVIGSRGHGSIASLVLGSVSAEVVDHAPCPVLVARRSQLGRVVFATDGSASATTAEQILARWPIFDGLPIRVVSVADVPQPWRTGIAPTMYAQVADAYARDLKEGQAEHRRLAEETAARLVSAGRDATADVRTGDAASEIIAAAAASDADLVVLGSRGRTGLTRALLGSVARNVAHGSEASTLVVRELARA